LFFSFSNSSFSLSNWSFCLSNSSFCLSSSNSFSFESNFWEGVGWAAGEGAGCLVPSRVFSATGAATGVSGSAETTACSAGFGNLQVQEKR